MSGAQNDPEGRDERDRLPARADSGVYDGDVNRLGGEVPVHAAENECPVRDVVAGHIVGDVNQGQVRGDSEGDTLHGGDIGVGCAEVRGEGEYPVRHGEGSC